MPLNLISDRWIPVLDKAGKSRIIAPWEMADESLSRPNWPRADLNIACLELLIGLVYLADPPKDLSDWDKRQAPDRDRLRSKLEEFAPAFNLTGYGPLFLQDLELLGGKSNPLDMLFIDGAGENTAKENADIMVCRNRYASLDKSLEPAMVAMALYTLQAHAPQGGSGHRTSMRGGGPLVTLVDPGQGLWSLIWANQPHGSPGKIFDLPWMRKTQLFDKDQKTRPPEGTTLGVEVFFGMPRRLLLIEKAGLITGFVREIHGTNYAGWKHPLTPYSRKKVEEEALPMHTRAGLFGYRNWLGVLAERSSNDGLRERAQVLKLWDQRRRMVEGDASVQVAGWAMKIAKPLDFIYSVQPFVALDAAANDMLIGLVEAAGHAVKALEVALKPILAVGGPGKSFEVWKVGKVLEGECEAFYAATERDFRERFEDLKARVSPDLVAKKWLEVLKKQALSQFDSLSVPRLDQRQTCVIKKIIKARADLGKAFSGDGNYGPLMFRALEMEKPPAKKNGSAKSKGKAA